MTVKLHQAVAATFAVMGQELSDITLKMIVHDLDSYPLEGVLTALSRCRKELKRITVSEILERIPGGHPGAEEAWALVSPALNDEGLTVVWTAPMREAFGVALPLRDDRVAARMAFKETYTKAVAIARESRDPVAWMPSLGQDVNGREAALEEAVAKGRITFEHAARCFPQLVGVSTSVEKVLKSAADQFLIHRRTGVDDNPDDNA